MGKKRVWRCSHHGAAETNLTRNYEVVGSIPGLDHCVKDLALLWLWCRPATIALIRPLAWEPPYAAGVALEKVKRQKKKKKKEKEAEYFGWVRPEGWLSPHAWKCVTWKNTVTLLTTRYPEELLCYLSLPLLVNTERMMYVYVCAFLFFVPLSWENFFSLGSFLKCCLHHTSTFWCEGSKHLFTGKQNNTLMFIFKSF